MIKIRYVGKKPTRATEGSAAFDLRAAASIRLAPHVVTRVPLGIRTAMIEGDVLFLFIRSGLAAKGLMLANGVGVIDSDYRGEIAALIYNTNDNEVSIEEGARVAQAIPINLPYAYWDAVHELPPTERGEGGFGSTGT